jgi:FkbM family methyltransferase
MFGIGAKARSLLSRLAGAGVEQASDQLLQFPVLLERYLNKKGCIQFVQVGANDGKYVDPLYDFIVKHHGRLSGVVIEPMTRAFRELERTYADFPNITPLNVAIHNEKSEAVLYQIDPEMLDSLPEFYKGVASFDSTHFDKTDTPKEYVIQETVRCCTLDAVLEEFSIADLDLLQIDSEGYDEEIIRGLDFERGGPAILRFEHGLPQTIMTPEAFREIVDRLNSHGYQVVCDHYDAAAYRIDDFI